MSGQQTPVFRFAPSPNGELHLGHALSAIIGHDWARHCGGRFLVRIEDIDVVRARDAFVRSILDDLAWLGLTWDGPVLRQSELFADYKRAADVLRASGLLYPCFATRGEIAAAVGASAALGIRERHDPDGAPIYPGLWRHRSQAEIAGRIASGESYALRLDMPRAIEAALVRLGGAPLTYCAVDRDGRRAVERTAPDRWGDAIMIRKDTPASYHLAVVVDDARQGVTHVTRGQDLEAATDIHRLLQVLLGLPEPVYHHHGLVLGTDGRKLSKSTGAPRLKDLRKEGASPADIQAMLAPFLTGSNVSAGP